MGQSNGVHHLAIATADIKTQIEFFSDVLGMELVALYGMHGVEGAWHGFLKLNDTSSVAFVQTPEIGQIDRTLGVTHAGNAGRPVAGGAMQHVAVNVDSKAELLALRDRIRLRTRLPARTRAVRSSSPHSIPTSHGCAGTPKRPTRRSLRRPTR